MPATTPITTLIFDVDDTMYDVGSGFTAHRNGYGALSFMVEKLKFPDMESAKEVRDEYFQKYHSTAKALTIAEEEGKLPPEAPKFKTEDLSDWWATQLDFTMLEPDAQLLEDLKSCPLKLVAFSNGPRKYVIRVLKQLGLHETIFTDSDIFAIDDVLPHSKPEKGAFEVVFDAVGKKAAECVMIEDSMKNVRSAKMLGMKTILVSGSTQQKEDKSDGSIISSSAALAAASEATKKGDAPDVNDPAVDASIAVIGEMKEKFPGLWQVPADFESNG
mmetsp:Transcript_11960/g.18485  ORF Transcript_11960/g.18485 Transcript_11960/m.18485 type:complete len:274 (-) Transcript_11960:1560-2381(-)